MINTLPIRKPHLRIRQTASYLLRRPPMSPIRFILFGRGRSGTTALVSLLDGVKEIHCDGEILSTPVLLPKLYLQSCSANSPTIAYGCKVLSYHIRDVQPLLQRRRFLHHLDKAGFKIIYLQRRNLFLHALSNIRARVSGYSQKKTDGPTKAKVIHVKPESILDWMQRSKRKAAYELELLQGLDVLALTYEDNIQDSSQHQPTVDKICDFLGVPSSPVTSAYRKQSPGRWQDAIANHEELTEFFENTPYAQYLQDS
ncbi:sulfotransferase family protein [Leptothoe spongobia]|uniref:Sulfotransferase n=1 Tax=Leptothoe spongobia TAU-MAC 1115 TaxID=1967444 RepID=A0A947DCK7_9CYAN|nr:hypothetical protein [Leptothoe spongobia]MBT9314626.1 hypothetical protein [Leptothoe spongobia TAU-MAC 1115]